MILMLSFRPTLQPTVVCISDCLLLHVSTYSLFAACQGAISIGGIRYFQACEGALDKLKSIPYRRFGSITCIHSHPCFLLI